MKQTDVTILLSSVKMIIQLNDIDHKLKKLDYFESMSLRAYLPAGLDRWRLYGVIQNACLPLGLSMKPVHCMFKAGGSKQFLHFARKTREKLMETELIRECLDVMMKISLYINGESPNQSVRRQLVF